MTIFRPLVLEKTVKTAIIFYLTYAVLLAAVTFWPPSFKITFSSITNSPSAMITGTSDLRLKQQEYKKSWHQILVEDGYIPQGVYKLQTERLNERQEGSEKVQWTSSESTIVLPVAATKSQLVRLTSQWQTLTHNLGFDVNSARWGYSNGYLWVKLSSSVRLLLAGHVIKLPLEQATFIQLVSEFKGKIPGLLPAFPPEFVPILPKVQTKEIPKIPFSKQPKIETPLYHKVRAKVAIIIDDVGYVTTPADEMVKVPAHLTWSILPDAPYTQKYSEVAREHGIEILLHLPLEPISPNTNPGPGLIKRTFTDEEIADQLDKDLEQLPEAVGINNHMGSAGTSDDRLMGVLMKEIKKHQLFFVDSMTIAGSVAGKYARLNQIHFAKRKVFIDNEGSLNAKKEALRELIRIALRDGEAIGIAHVREGTAEAIIEMLPEFAKAGIEIVPVSELVR
jgi:polysaccharide deacetylase 2 family uncharacterized protein YibQ